MNGSVTQAQGVKIADQGGRFHTHGLVESVGDQVTVVQRGFHRAIKPVVRPEQALVPVGIQALGEKWQTLFEDDMQQGSARPQRFE